MSRYDHFDIQSHSFEAADCIIISVVMMLASIIRDASGLLTSLGNFTQVKQTTIEIHRRRSKL